MTHPVEHANAAFASATTDEKRRDAILLWLAAVVELAEASWPAPGRRGSPGVFLASALQDLNTGYTPRVLKQADIGDDRGKTRGGKASARARAVAAVQIVEDLGAAYKGQLVWAVRLVTWRNGQTEGALISLLKNIAHGKEQEVSSLVDSEKQKWLAQFAEPNCEHENLLLLVLTELAADRNFFKKPVHVPH